MARQLAQGAGETGCLVECITSPRKGARKLRTRLSIALVIVGLRGRWLIFRPGTDYPGAHFNHGDNAAWLGVEWGNETHSEDSIAALAANLKQRQISTIYVYSSYLKASGNFNPSYAHAGAFISTLKARNPDLNVQAWIGLPLTYVDLESRATRTQITEFSAALVQDFGFDGIHYDPEPIANGDESVLHLLQETRAALPISTRLSIATRRIGVIFPETELPIWRPFAWSASYYRQVAVHVDEIAVMSYDSTLLSTANGCNSKSAP